MKQIQYDESINFDNVGTSLYSNLVFCVWGFHHPNGKVKSKRETEGSITEYCKGSDIESNMVDTALGHICVMCYKTIPEKYKKKIQ